MLGQREALDIASLASRQLALHGLSGYNPLDSTRVPGALFVNTHPCPTGAL